MTSPDFDSPTSDEPPRRRSRARLPLLLAFCAVCVAVPFFAVDLPPVTDLPQHLAQVGLFLGVLGGDTAHRIQWLTPYSLGYLPLLVAKLVASPAHLPRLAMLFLAASWVGAAAYLVRRRGRPVAALPLASLLFFNHVTYWGFVTFLFGWPLFVLWLDLHDPERPAKPRARVAAETFALAALLFLGHALWFAAAIAWLGVRWLGRRPLQWRWLAIRIAGAAPICLGAAVWYPRFAVGAFAKPAQWATLPWERLQPDWLLGATFGGLRGPTEAVVALVLVAWVVAALVQNRSRLATLVDRELILAAGFFLLLALVLPNSFRNTIAFAERWVPFAAALLLLAIPAPRLRPGMATALGCALLASLALATASAWSWFESEEQSGLAGSLEALPDDARVLGLEFVRESGVVRGLPFLQQFAYAQVFRGAALNFSFADFSPSLVVRAREPERRWQPGLEWFPERVSAGDFRAFDYVLVHGSPEIQARTASLPFLSPVQNEGSWRSYRIRHDAVDAELGRAAAAAP